MSASVWVAVDPGTDGRSPLILGAWHETGLEDAQDELIRYESIMEPTSPYLEAQEWRGGNLLGVARWALDGGPVAEWVWLDGEEVEVP